MNPCSPKYAYPVSVHRIASDVAARGIDIAPTRLAWERLASCLAAYCGEQGRDAFHKMAAVWPDYSRHDSELCYSRALRRTGRAVGIGYLANVLKPHGIDIHNARYRNSGPLQTIKPTTKNKTKTMKKINFNALLHSLLAGRPALGRNQLIDLLLRLYPQQAVLMACQRYLVGFNSFKTGNLGDALIYWQVNEQRKIINAKRIHYLADGHRNKQYPPIVMYPDNPQCLFGQHLINDDPEQPVAIVESEKSALIMSIAMPEYQWMACGSLNNFNERFLEPLRHRKVVAFPDLDSRRDKKSGLSVSTAAWLQEAQRLKAQGWNIRVDLWLEKNANTAQRLAKLDIADFALERVRQEHIERLKRPNSSVCKTNKTNKTNKTESSYGRQQ